ncbi:pyridoxal phosphate-dependent decarboxylase family protein [Winogradskyella sp.]
MFKDLNLFNLLCEELIRQEKEQPVSRPIPTELLFNKLDLSLNEEGIVDKDLIDTLTKIIKHTPKTASKSFFNQLFGGRMSKATLGDLLAVLLNNSMYTYKVAGPQVGIEKQILKNICNIIGYNNQGDGTMAPGGSMSNFMALIMARDFKRPSVRNSGVNDKMTIYTSKEAHYSIAKNASFAGIGRSQVREVNTNDKGEMLTSHLSYLINKDVQAGHIPFFVNATAGTTVLGAFDNILEISKVCKTHHLWLHVDGAYCGGVLFSKKYRYLLNGIEHSDSFSVNAHKMLGTPLSCSIVLTKHKEQLHKSFSNEADYLYQTDSDDFNLGKTSLQCGRRNDALKFWTLWKSIGTKGLEEMVNKQFLLAEVARQYIRDNKNYTLYSFENSISVCFNYRNISAKELCTALYEDSKLMVGFGKFNGIEFIRLVTINSVLEKEDIIAFFDTLEHFVAKKMLKTTT